MNLKGKMFKNILGLPILTLLILIISCSSEKNKKDSCEQYKNGKFLYHFRGHDKDFFFSVVRNDSIQIETDKKTGIYSKLSVKWIDKCKYELKMLETTFPISDSIKKISMTIPLKNEIISFTNDYYVFKSQRDNSNSVLTDTMWIEK